MSGLIDRLRGVWKGERGKERRPEGAMKLVVGLGNPGSMYENNRHNVGFRSVECFARDHGLEFRRRQGQAYVAAGRVGDIVVLLAKPQTFMNRSGQAVAALSRFYKIAPADVLVVYDDLDLPLGRIRVRERGSAGGHRGMGSVIASLGTQDVPRLRLGIGRPGEAAGGGHREAGEGDVVKHVLSDFLPGERPVVSEMCSRAAEVIETVLREGVVVGMNKYNA